MLPALALALDVRAGSQMDVAETQAGELGDPQAGLDGEHQQGVVAPSGSAVAVGAGQQSVDLGGGEEGDGGPLAPLGWDGKDSLDRCRMFRVAQGSEAEQRVHRGQAGIAGGHVGLAVTLEVVKEPPMHAASRSAKSSRDGGRPVPACT